MCVWMSATTPCLIIIITETINEIESIHHVTYTWSEFILLLRRRATRYTCQSEVEELHTDLL